MKNLKSFLVVVMVVTFGVGLNVTANAYTKCMQRSTGCGCGYTWSSTYCKCVYTGSTTNCYSGAYPTPPPTR